MRLKGVSDRWMRRQKRKLSLEIEIAVVLKMLFYHDVRVCTSEEICCALYCFSLLHQRHLCFNNVTLLCVSYFWCAVDCRNRDKAIIHRNEIKHSCIFSIVAFFYLDDFITQKPILRTAQRNSCSNLQCLCVSVIIENMWMKCGLWPWQGTIISVSLTLWGEGAWHLNLSRQERRFCFCMCDGTAG